MKLNEIADNKGARHHSKRVGRGIGSGKGKTAARGVKGQKSRTGVALAGFEGGQTPLHRRLPKRGFNRKMFRKEWRIVNLSRLQEALDRGRLEAEGTIDAARLAAAGVIRRRGEGVRLLGKGEIKGAITITVAGASKKAVAAIEKAGGRVVLEPRGTGQKNAKEAS